MSHNKEEPFPWKPDIDQPRKCVKGDDILSSGFVVLCLILLVASVSFHHWVNKAYPDPSPTVVENIKCK